MNTPKFMDLWTYIGPFLGVVLGFLGNFLLERRRERIKREEGLQLVECIEILNFLCKRIQKCHLF